MELYHERHFLPTSILEIVLKVTETNESVMSQIWRTQTKSYGLDELDTNQNLLYVKEWASWIWKSNLRLKSNLKIIFRRFLRVCRLCCSYDDNSPWADTFFLAPLGGQNIIWILVTSVCLLSRKVWCVVRIGSFCPKLRYFIDQNRPKEGPHQNEFWLFSNTKMNVTNS